MNLRDRCKEFYQRMQRDAMLRQGSPVDDLMAFVMSENGRAADPRLERTQARDNRHCRDVFAENVKFGGMP